MDAAQSIAAVICAAGSSSRMGGIKKEYQRPDNSVDGGGLTVLGMSVCAFVKASVQTIVIAVPENGEATARKALPSEYLSAETPKIFFVNGGNTRRASVHNALSFLAPYNPNYVLIHDGARPWVSPLLIENIITAVKKHDAVIPLLALTDTPKECNAPFEASAQTVFVKTHLKRTHTGIAQTPQAFKFPQILEAHKKAALEQEDFTDDAEIWGRFCGTVAVISGSPENRKITFLEDINR